MVTLADAALKERIDSERNQGRAPDMDWLDHDRLGFNYRLSEIACAIGLAQLERLDGHARGARARSPRAYREALARDRGARAALPRRGRRRARLVRLHRRRCRAASTATRRSAALRERGVQSKPYLPAIHLMSYYRETFGHRPGEFPVCEDIAARSLALPFFPALERGRGRAGRRRALDRGACGADVDWRRDVALLASRQHPDFQAINASLAFDRRLWPYDVAQSRAHAAHARVDRRDRRATSATSCWPGSTPSRRSCGPGASRSRPTTRTSTWRSSGG